MKARDIMCRRVFTVTPNMTLLEAVKLLSRHGISGAPVVGPRRRLLGVVSQTDLLRRHEQQAVGEVPAFYREGERIAFTTVTEEPGRARVAEVMTPAALCAGEDTPVAELARFMLARRVHRVVIVTNGAVRGIVTTMDMLRVVAGNGQSRKESGPSRRSGRAARRSTVRSGRRARGRLNSRSAARAKTPRGRR